MRSYRKLFGLTLAKLAYSPFANIIVATTSKNNIPEYLFDWLGDVFRTQKNDSTGTSILSLEQTFPI